MPRSARIDPVDRRPRPPASSHGVLDEVRVWNVARTPAQIQRDQEHRDHLGHRPRRALGSQRGLRHERSTDSIATAANGTITGTGSTRSVGLRAAGAGQRRHPAAPTLNAPANAGTGISTSPTLSVGVSDPDADPLTVTFFGRPFASGNYVQIAQHTGVASGATDTTTWSSLGAGQTFQWYVTVSDGA